MARYALISQENVVINVIMWDGAPWQPPANTFVVQSDTANIGDIYSPETGTFSQPTPVE